MIRKIIRIDEEACTGCGTCIEKCPQTSIVEIYASKALCAGGTGSRKAAQAIYTIDKKEQR